jgi:two-component system response regulator HydG
VLVAMEPDPTGTGKDGVSKGIHALSSRASAPYVAVNCAELTAELFAARMYGNRKNWPSAPLPETPGYFGAAGRQASLDTRPIVSR